MPRASAKCPLIPPSQGEGEPWHSRVAEAAARSIFGLQQRHLPDGGGRRDDGERSGLGHHRIRGLQIVNGGQTTASIHRAGKMDKFDCRVLLSVGPTGPVLKPELVDALAPKIAEYANTQEPRSRVDFSANDPSTSSRAVVDRDMDA